MRNRGSLYKNYQCDIDSSRFRPPEAPNTRFGLNTLPHGFDRKIRLNGHYVIAFVSPLPTSVVIRGRFPIFEASCFSNRYKIKDRQPGQIRRSHFCRSSAAHAVDEPEPKPGIGTYTKLRTPRRR